MPLDLTIVREPVKWNREISAALRESVEALEDHLIGLGYDDLELRLEVRKLSADLAGVQADLMLPVESISRHGEDIDIGLLFRRVLEDVQDEATPTRLGQGGAVARMPALPAPDPWTAIRADLYAIAHREVRHAVEFGDLPAGWVEASDLTDEAILESLSRPGVGAPSLRSLARRVRVLLAHRIRTAAEAADNVFLDEIMPVTDASEAAVQDEYYEFRVADEAPLRRGEVVGEFEPAEDRIAVDEPTEPQ